MDTVVIFTSKDTEKFFEEGGSGDWVANKARLAKCSYLVAVANAHSSWSRHTEDRHAHAFLVGKVSGAFQSKNSPGSARLVIEFNEFALIDVPNAWGGQRNPVRYTSISEFGIDPGTLEWRKFPTDRIKEVDTTSPLTVEEAKKGLAKQLGISSECIEITIRA